MQKTMTRADVFKGQLDVIFNSLHEMMEKTFTEAEQAEVENYEIFTQVISSYSKEIKKLTQDNLALKIQIKDLEQKLDEQVQANHGVPGTIFYDHQDAERFRSQNKELVKQNKELKAEIQKLKNPPVSRYSITRKSGVKKGE